MRPVFDRAPDGAVLTTWPLPYRKGDYELVQITSKDISSKDKVMIIRAGIHGDETEGPLTLRRSLDSIFEYAHLRGVKLAVFPMDNPSAFNTNRYNIDGDEGEYGNNDYLRYELADGSIVGELDPGQDKEFVRYGWSSDFPSARLPLETRVSQRALRTLPIDRVYAALDIHQDNFLPGIGSYFYAYNNIARYRDTIYDVDQVVPVLRDVEIGSGYKTGARSTGADGCIKRRDGSFTDLFDRLGVCYSVAIETAKATPPELVHKVHLLWIYNLIDRVRITIRFDELDSKSGVAHESHPEMAARETGSTRETE